MGAKVVIFTEGGSRIGFGHITRCLALYQAIEEMGGAPFLAVNGDATVRKVLKGLGHRIFDWKRDEKGSARLLEDADAAIVDSYLADKGFYSRVSSFVKVAAYIDDNRRIGYPRGIVINGTIGSERFAYPKIKGITYLLGSRFIPLREPFWHLKRQKIRKTAKRVLVIFGGNDLRGMTPKVVKLLASKFPHLSETVIVGGSLRGQNEIKEARGKGCRLLFSPEAGRIAGEMLGSDIAVSAGGQTLYELARAGIPTAAVGAAKNQVNNLKGWKRTGFLDVAGYWNDRDLLTNLSARIGDLLPYHVRRKKSAAGKRLVDGQGALRIARAIMDEISAKQLVFRKAKAADCLLLLSWRNHPKTRRWSFNQDRIGLDEHSKWFKGRLSGKKGQIYICEDGESEKIGQIRFDRISGKRVGVSVNLNPSFIGKGYGVRIIRDGTHLFMRKRADVREVIAEILSGNEASIEAFRKAGYRFEHAESKGGRRVLTYRFVRG